MDNNKKTTNKKKLTKVEKTIIVICYFIVAVCILYMLYLDRFDLLKKKYNNYIPQEINLTEEQKIEDFEYFYNTMVTSYPMLEDYKNVLGYDYNARKDFYEELVRATTSDYEFYSVMRGIVNEFPSFHTDLVFPEFSRYEALGCYNMTSTLINGKVYPAALDWEQILKNEYKKVDLSETTYVGYKYINGEYVMTSDVGELNQGTKIIQVNGIDIHEYVFQNPFSVSDKSYDTQYERIYLPTFYVNDKVGEPIVLTLEDTTGNVFEKEVFCETTNSMGLNLHWAFRETTWNPSVIDNPVYDYVDEERNIGYIRIASFYTMWVEDIETALEKMQDCERIILDLRDNYGGLPMVAQKYIYPHLFAEDVTMNSDWYMIDSKSNQRVLWEDISSLLFRFNFRKVKDTMISSEKEYQYLASNRRYEYEGYLEEEKDIYVLINSASGSAADGFAAALKKTSATIIGENTAGEGLADSFMCDYLPNSGLVFTYMFGKGINEDSTDNSLYGTVPDVYAHITVEGYDKCYELQLSEKDPYTYENRLLWDDVLIEAVER